MTSSSTSAPVQSLCSSAKKMGLSDYLQAATTQQTCPFMAQTPGTTGTATMSLVPPKPVTYEYCDIQELKIELAGGDKSQAMTLTKRRRPDGVANGVAKEYKGVLQGRDLVIEALADVKDETTSTAGTVDSKDAKPLKVTVTAKNSSKHVTKTPAHPLTKISGPEINTVTHGGAPVTAKIWLEDTGALGKSTFSAVWPFDSYRRKTFDLLGETCGVKKGGGATTDLTAQLVVLPYEEWKISIGLGPAKSGSWEKEKDWASERGGPGGDKVAVTTTKKKMSGDTELTDKSERYSDKAKDVVNTRSERTIRTGIIAGQSLETSETQTLYGKTKASRKWQDDPNKKKTEARKLTIKRVVGGRESEVELTKTINKIMEVKKIIDDVKKVFDSVKLGWSISFSYELFSGSLDLGWGYRWPLAYVEEDRVWYVERFISVGGSCTLVQGKVEGMFGLEIDPWYAPVSFVAKIYLSAVAKVEASAGIEMAYTNSASYKGVGGKLGMGGSVTLELGAKAGGRVAGYSVDARLAIEGKAELKLDGSVSFREPLKVAYTLIIGTETTVGGVTRTDAVRLVGEVITVGSTTDRYAFDPIELVKGKTIAKDQPLW